MVLVTSAVRRAVDYFLNHNSAIRPSMRNARSNAMTPASVAAIIAGLLLCSAARDATAQTAPESQQQLAKPQQPDKPQSPPGEPLPRLADPLAAKFLAAHCQECHEGAKPKGDFLVAKLTLDFASKKGRQPWSAVAEQLQAGTMPPVDRPRPAPAEVKALLDWIGRQLAAKSNSTNSPQNGPSPSGGSSGGPSGGPSEPATATGRTVMRRLTQTEYVNTVRDLLLVDVDMRDLISPETSTSGFDNTGAALHLSSHQLENYLLAAERAIDAAIASGPRPPTISRRVDIKDEKSVKPKGSVYRHLDDGVAIFSSWVSANIQVTLWNFQTRHRGKYRFRISGYGYQTDKPVDFHVMAGPMNAAAQQFLIGYYDVPAKEPRVVEFTESLDPNHTIRIIADNLGAIPPEVEKIGAENYKGPGLVVQWVDVEGPLLESWPPPSHQRLFGELKQQRVSASDRTGRLEVVSSMPAADAEMVIRNFARRAFRRPPADAELKPIFARMRAKLDRGATFEEAVRTGLRAVLVAPGFLFLREPAGRLDDYALASRLSYFLWSSMPDDELFALAERGELRRPEILRQQVERLLRDPKAAAFTENFTGQWLGLRSIDATMPDRMLYPEFDDVLKVSSVKETLMFFDEVLRNDLSVTNFVSSNFTFVNGRLAQHYGLPGIEGMELRKVPLPADGRRGGVLTMASVLKVTANGTTTSPILRGAWVLDRILGTPPPKPTIDIEAVEPDIRGATTIRHQLEKHRERSDCRGCHALIDPPGFALENYDVIGGWRDRYRSIGQGEPVVVDGRRRRYLNGPPVESSDVLLDGRPFRDIGEFKGLLLTDPDQLAKALTTKLLAYATGAEPSLADQPRIAAIVERAKDKQYGLKSLIHEIVQSDVFQTK